MITVVGHTAVDHISRVTSLPGPNGSTTITDRQILFGGGAANIAAGIARLGGDAELLSAVGGDFRGSAYERWLAELGVRPRLFVVEGAHTATAFMFTDETTGAQMTFFEWGASVAFQHEEAPPLDFVHMATADPAFNRQVAERAGFASFDPGQDLHRYTAEDLNVILDHIDLLFANQHEVAGMCSLLGLSRDELKARVPIAVFTEGSGGSCLVTDGREVRIPIVPVGMADPTGAGDAYRAGFLTAYVRGYPLETCCRIGTVTASFAVERPGCQTNLPGWEEMRARYERHFGALMPSVS
ncbi:MAG TPA: carbohydrate kinase family protein [Methanoregulaceae archaeon]|nr:carbohydrate kinase family protein [Methanoregulaceae archaeon]